MIYSFLKYILTIGLHFYYGKIKILDKKKLSKNKPYIIISNHPNTLTDAWIVGLSINRPIHIMAKGTYFNSKFKKWLLKKINLIPVARKGEENTGKIDNSKTFEKVYELLEENKVVLIFPEGSSFPERKLRPLKVGTARMGLEVEKRNDFNLNLDVLPIGINYEKGNSFRSKIVVKVGDFISFNDYKSILSEDNIKEISYEITDLFTKELEKLTFNTKSIYHDENLKKVEAFYNSNTRKISPLEILENTQNLNIALEKIEQNDSNKYNDLIQNLELYHSYLKRLGLKSNELKSFSEINKTFYIKVLKGILLVIPGILLLSFSWIHNMIPAKLTDLLTKKITKEKEYYSSVRIVLGLMIFSFYYFVVLITENHIYPLTTFGKIIYAFSMPLSGIIANRFGLYIKREINEMKYYFLFLKKRNLIHKVLRLKTKIRKQIE